MSLKPPDLNNEFQGNIFYFQTYLVFSTILGSNHSYKTKADHLKGKTEKKAKKVYLSMAYKITEIYK